MAKVAALSISKLKLGRGDPEPGFFITGVGGGTVRDLLLDLPVFWVRDASPIIACLIASVTVFSPGRASRRTSPHVATGGRMAESDATPDKQA
jgi:hypothetical protein